jgi:hypothetical protein
MAAKQFWSWINSSGTKVDRISANGVYTLAAYGPDIRSDIPTMISVISAGSDPAGAVVTAGLRIAPGGTPENISGVSATLPSITTSSYTFSNLFYPKGEICITVTGIVNPFKAGVLQ